MDRAFGLAREVLTRYGLTAADISLTRLGNRGGFSGACLWRVEGQGGPYCLRAWPARVVSPVSLSGIHKLMTRARGAELDFVPKVFPTLQHTTWVEHTGRYWDLTSWQPGQADFHGRPTKEKLAAACEALARLHLAWSQAQSSMGPCPAVQRRLDCLQEWTNLLESGWRPTFSIHRDPIHRWAQRAWSLLPALVKDLPQRLAFWRERQLPLQPCLCDIWHDHVLFVGDSVTGLVDYGSVKIDHVAVDSARLLGSLVGNDTGQQALGLQAYGRLYPLSSEERGLVRLLDETGTLLGAVNWLRWLYWEKRVFEDVQAVARRLAEVVQRMEEWIRLLDK